MFRPPARSIAALVLAVLLAPGLGTRPESPVAGAQGPPARPSGSGLILGRVVEGLSDTPVADALVGIRGRAEPYLRRSALTDADGNFVFLDVPPGSYTLNTSKDGSWSGSFGERRPNGGGRAVVLAAGQHLADLRVPVWTFAAISGVVVDELGEPVVGVNVQAMGRYATGGRPVMSNSSPSTAVTDDRGMYRLFGLIPGEFVVSIPSSELTAAGWRTQAASDPAGELAYPSVFHPGGVTAAEASPLALVSGEERRGIDLQLRLTRTHRVSGRLVGAAGGGITVRLVRADERFVEDFAVADSLSRADGSFTITRVPPGSYALRVFDMAGGPGGGGFGAVGGRGAGSAGAGSVEPSDAKGWWAWTPVTVGDADVTDVAVALRASLRIAGRFVFNGAAPPPTGYQDPRMFMRASQPSGRFITRAGGRNVYADAAAGFTTSGLPAGRYFVRLASSQMPQGWALESIVLNGRDAMDEPVALDDHDFSGLVITLTDKVSEVAGFVRTAAGSPDPDVAVLVFPANPARWIDFGADPPRMRSVRVGLDGAYSVKGLPPGEYLAVAVNSEYTDAWQLQTMLERLSRSAGKFTLAVGERKTLDLHPSQVR